MRKALVIGINKYPKGHELRGCVNDATAFSSLIETHGDGSPNFEVLTATDVSTRNELSSLVEKLYAGENDIALFYFSGHGMENNMGTYLVTPDALRMDAGLSMDELITMANKSKAKNKVIILDCCHSGAAGSAEITAGVLSTISKGITVLTSSKSDESSMEVNGHGVFTNLLLNALKGGAADIRGDISPGGIYAYIDQALGAWDQRPVFKTNITEFVSLRNIPPRVPIEKLRKISSYFPTPDVHFELNPSFEFTNDPNVEHSIVEPYADPTNVEIFKDLQKFNSVGLVEPVGAEHMYFAAIHSKSCKLTALGLHYWRLASKKKLGRETNL